MPIKINLVVDRPYIVVVAIDVPITIALDLQAVGNEGALLEACLRGKKDGTYSAMKSE